MAADRSVMFQGFTRIAPAPRDCEAPVNSLRINTPVTHQCKLLKHWANDECEQHLQLCNVPVLHQDSHCL